MFRHVVVICAGLLLVFSCGKGADVTREPSVETPPEPAVESVPERADVAQAAGEKVYPGATVDEAATQATREMAGAAGTAGMRATIYVTSDGFDKVAAFYGGFAKEYVMPGMGRTAKLPSGQDINQAFFILDDGESLADCAHWVKVQRPYVAGMQMKGGRPTPEDVRDVTAIVEVKKE